RAQPGAHAPAIDDDAGLRLADQAQAASDRNRRAADVVGSIEQANRIAGERAVDRRLDAAGDADVLVSLAAIGDEHAARFTRLALKGQRGTAHEDVVVAPEHTVPVQRRGEDAGRAHRDVDAGERVVSHRRSAAEKQLPGNRWYPSLDLEAAPPGEAIPEQLVARENAIVGRGRSSDAAADHNHGAGGRAAVEDVAFQREALHARCPGQLEVADVEVRGRAIATV